MDATAREHVSSSAGRLVLVDHIRSASKPIYWVQKIIEFFSLRFEGEHMTRRPLEHVQTLGFDIIERERRGPGGVIERLTAVRPSAA